MNVWTFLRDRLFYILIYFLNVFLVLLIIQLDFLQSGLFLKKENIIYMFVLSVTVIVFYLGVSYIRQLPLQREFNRMKRASGIDRVLRLQSAANREQQAFRDALYENYREYVNDLIKYQERQKQHHHFMNQWVHSMKTPVSVINLLIQQSNETSSLDEAKKLLRSIGEENERLAHGLEMVLHTARLEEFELDVSLKRVDLVDLVRTVINEHKKEMIRYAIFPRIECDHDEVFVETDRKWMAFVLNQVTGNAIKYSEKGANRRIIYAITKTGSTCILSVTDEGVGIPKQDRRRIFDPFFTGENRRTGAESTGMGLYLANEVCSRLGHRLSVDSEEGGGTTVTMTFSGESIIGDTLKG